MVKVEWERGRRVIIPCRPSGVSPSGCVGIALRKPTENSKIRNHRTWRETEGTNSGFIGSCRGYPRSNPNPNPNPNRSDVAVALGSVDLYRHPQPRHRRCSAPSSPPLVAHTVSINFVGLRSGSDRVSEEWCGRLSQRVVRANLGQRPAWRSDEISLATQVGVWTDGGVGP